MPEIRTIQSDHPDRYRIAAVDPAAPWANAYVGCIHPDGDVLLVFASEPDADGVTDEVEVKVPQSVASALSRHLGSHNLI